MHQLEQLKTILEVTVLALFLILLIHVWRRRGHEHALTLLTNKP